MKISKIDAAFKDERGSITDILENKDIKHVGIIESKAKTIRANHYHKKATQWTYVISGKIKLFLKDPSKKTSKIESFIMGPGELVEIPPLIIHAVDSIEKSVILILTDQPRINNSYEHDTFRVKIVK